MNTPNTQTDWRSRFDSVLLKLSKYGDTAKKINEESYVYNELIVFISNERKLVIEEERERLEGICTSLLVELYEKLSLDSTKLTNEKGELIYLVPSSMEMTEQMRGIRMVKERIKSLSYHEEVK